MIAALIEHVWQSTVFALVMALLALVLRRHAARVRHAVWMAASITFVIPFSWLTLVGHQLAPRHEGAAPVVLELLANTAQQMAQPFSVPIPVPPLTSTT